MEWLKGKKTFILGVVAIIGAVAGVVTGTIDLATAWSTIQVALASMAIRDGITTKNAKTP